MDNSKEWEWECLDDITSDETWRMKVPGGWILKSITSSANQCEASSDTASPVALVFIPEPQEVNNQSVYAYEENLLSQSQCISQEKP